MSWYGTIGHDVGFVVTRFAAVIASLSVIAVAWREYYALPAVLLSAALAYLVGRLLLWMTSSTEDTSTAQALAAAAVTWLVVGLLSTLPFVFVAWTIVLNPTPVQTPSLNPTTRVLLSVENAAFEAISGITGTGLTMTRRASNLPATLQFWRSLLEWLGGIGIIVLILTVVRGMEDNVLDQYYKERSPLGRAGDDIPPPKLMLGAYTAFTFGSVVLLWLAGMPAWHALNHGMTGLSTGGFAVTDASIAAYDSLGIYLTLMPIMVVGAIPLPVYYLLLEGKLEGFAADLQTRWLVAICIGGTGLVAVLLSAANTYASASRTAVLAAFQFVSAITCTGFSTAPNMSGSWPPVAILTLIVAMVIGGAEGSTASGVKIVRVVSLIKGIRERVSEPFPDIDQSWDIEISGEHVSANFYNASIILALWLGFLLAGVFTLLVALPPGQISLQQALFEVASAQGNVGLSSGITTASLATGAKLVLMFHMWIGRLTIIPVLVLLRGVL